MNKFRKIYSWTFIITLFCLFFTSCDDVKEDDRYIEGPAITAERAVLLEDFTGQNCVNCPEAHEVIKQLQQQYGEDKVIAVSIHSGALSIPVSYTNFDAKFVGLMTAEGNAICEAFGINQFPMGVIDNGDPQVYDLWPTSMRKELEKATDIDLELEAKYIPSSDDRSDAYYGTIEVNCEVLSGSTRSANIQFWITEDNIIARQSTLTGTEMQYVHDNVFRAQIFGGLKGQSINLKGGVSDNVTGSINTRWTDSERWEINNLYVVAFVSDNKEVLQVTKVKLIKD